MIDHLMYKHSLKNTSRVTLISGEKHELKFTREIIFNFFFFEWFCFKWMFNTSGRQYKEAIGT